jgi:hypothetical protein
MDHERAAEKEASEFKIAPAYSDATEVVNSIDASLLGVAPKRGILRISANLGASPHRANGTNSRPTAQLVRID